MRFRTRDPEVARAIMAEQRRQADDLELIASENYVSPDVLEALGTVLTNKYAEGLPGKRYYGGCQHVDVVEELARSRALQLFGVTSRFGCNVQPHAGAQANAAVYLACLRPGDTLLGLNLSHGGHLTHGSPVNFSGLVYHAVHYGVGADGYIDLDAVRDIALKERPRLIMTGGSAYPRVWDFQGFRAIADEIGAVLVCDMAHFAGLVAAGLHPDPFVCCDYVTTTTHKTLRGPRGGLVFGRMDLMKGLNSAVFPGTQGGPLMHCIAAKAVALGEALQPSFRKYIEQVVDNAKAMANRLMEHGFVLVSGGTDNHLMLVDLSKCGYSGKEAEVVLGEAGITVNKNTVPGEQRSPFVTSGIRIGTPAMTTRGCTVPDAVQIADWVNEALTHRLEPERVADIKGRVRELMQRRPIPGGFISDDTIVPVKPDWDCDAHGESGHGRLFAGQDPGRD